MHNLKSIKMRIDSVYITQKVTNAMRMIAVSNLKKSHRLLLDSYPYLDEITRMVRRLVRSLSVRKAKLPMLIQGKESKKKYFIICVTSDKGLCGRFTQNITAKTQQLIDFLLQEGGYSVQLICFGNRGAEILRKQNPNLSIHVVQKQTDDQNSLFADAQVLAHGLIDAFYMDEFDVCTVVYNRFKNVATQTIQIDQLIPLQTFQHENKWQFLMDAQSSDWVRTNVTSKADSHLFSVIGAKHLTATWGQADANAIAQETTRLPDSYDYDKSDTSLLDAILVPFMEAHVYQILLNSIASENAARMIAMEGACKNSSEMMSALQKKYHRKRQEKVTTDLNEVVSGITG